MKNRPLLSVCLMVLCIIAFMVEWRRDCLWSDKCIAHINVDGWIGLLRILQPHANMTNDGYGNFKEDPEITIQCKEFPEKCEVIDSCPEPVGVACWEQYLKYRHCKDEMEANDVPDNKKVIRKL